MTTTKILFSGKHLFVNANAEGGQLTVEVLDGSGVTLRGFAADRCIPIRAEGTRQMVRWQSSSGLSRLTNWQAGAHPVLPRSRAALFVLGQPKRFRRESRLRCRGRPGP